MVTVIRVIRYYYIITLLVLPRAGDAPTRARTRERLPLVTALAGAIRDRTVWDKGQRGVRRVDKIDALGKQKGLFGEKIDKNFLFEKTKH